jgi:hypothetical protein
VRELRVGDSAAINVRYALFASAAEAPRGSLDELLSSKLKKPSN